MTTYHHIHDEIKDLNKKLFHFVELCEIKTRIAARRKLCPVCVNIDLNAVMSMLKYKDLPNFTQKCVTFCVCVVIRKVSIMNFARGVTHHHKVVRMICWENFQPPGSRDFLALKRHRHLGTFLQNRIGIQGLLYLQYMLSNNPM